MCNAHVVIYIQISEIAQLLIKLMPFIVVQRHFYYRINDVEFNVLTHIFICDKFGQLTHHINSITITTKIYRL